MNIGALVAKAHAADRRFVQLIGEQSDETPRVSPLMFQAVLEHVRPEVTNDLLHRFGLALFDAFVAFQKLSEEHPVGDMDYRGEFAVRAEIIFLDIFQRMFE